MFQLYKKRDFSGYVSDTVSFFKQYWKNYFTNFVIITGALLLILCVIYFFVFRDFFSASMLGRLGNYDFSAYFQDNMVSFIVLIGIAVVVTIVFSIACMLYPVAYLQLVEKTGRDSFTSGELLDQMKSQIGRVLLFSLLSLFTLFPLLMIAMAISFVAIFLIVGIFLIIMLIPIASVWTMQSFYVFMNQKTDYFEALGQGWRILFNKKFWHIIGATFVVYMVINIIQGIFTMIPYFMMIFTMLGTGDTANFESSGFVFFLTAIYIISIVMSYLLGNFLMITQGLIYYSSLEQKEHTQAFSEIDRIGQNAE